MNMTSKAFYSPIHSWGGMKTDGSEMPAWMSKKLKI